MDPEEKRDIKLTDQNGHFGLSYSVLSKAEVTQKSWKTCGAL